MIVGLDPGTTVGYACIDCSGNLILIDSEKHVSLDEVISRVIRLGKPVAVACDVRKAPGFVEKFSASTRAKLIIPEKDLQQRDKEIMTMKWKGIVTNKHRRSALASALHAYGVLRPLLKKIEKKLNEKNNLEAIEKVIGTVLTRNVSISSAQERISSKSI